MSFEIKCDICGMVQSSGVRMHEVTTTVVDLGGGYPDKVIEKHYCSKNCCIDRFLEAVERAGTKENQGDDAR